MRYLRYSLPLLALTAFFHFNGGPIAAARAETADDKTAPSIVHEQRDAFARSFANTVLAILQDQKKSFGDRKTVLRQAFSKSVDIDWIARFVLGSAWNQANEDQKKRYMSLYRTYLTESYVANFAENPDKRIRDIKIFGVHDGDGDDFTVRTQMMLADMENLSVNYLVWDNNGSYKVRDIAIENVSLITTHRTEFTKLAATKGIDGVIARLEELTENKLAMNNAS